MAAPITHPAWLDRVEYPFVPHTFHHPDGRMHWVDEGSGPVILFVHGTPDWSFGFRHLISAFSTTHRCVAPDHLGFGLSDKPPGATYTVAAHARRLQDLIDHLGLKDVTLVVTDFGGGIGLQHAFEHPANVQGLVIYNTWMWPLGDDPRLSKPARMMRGWLGRMLYRHLNFSVNVMMPGGYADKRKLTPLLHAQYKQVFPTVGSREALHVLVRELLDAGPFWANEWTQVHRLQQIPTLLAWGLKDRFLPPDFLDRWKLVFPGASVMPLPEAGHFIHEEAPEELVSGIRKLPR